MIFNVGWRSRDFQLFQFKINKFWNYFYRCPYKIFVMSFKILFPVWFLHFECSKIANLWSFTIQNLFFLFSNVVNMSKYLLICFVWYCIYRKVPNVSILPTENKYYYIGILEYEISKSVLIIKKSRGYRILIITWRYQSWFMWYRSGFMFLMFRQITLSAVH